MVMKPKNGLIILCLALLLLSAIYLYFSASPRYSFYLVGKALKNHDVELFNKFVDVDSVVDEWVHWSSEQAKQEIMNAKASLRNPLGENLVELMIPNMRIKLKEEFKRSILENVEYSGVTQGAPLINMILLPVEKMNIGKTVTEITIRHPKTKETIIVKMRRTPQRYWRITSIQVPSLMKVEAKAKPEDTANEKTMTQKPAALAAQPAVAVTPLPIQVGKELAEKKAQIQETSLAKLEREYMLAKTVAFTEYYQIIRDKIAQHIAPYPLSGITGKANLKLTVLSSGDIIGASVFSESPAAISSKIKELVLKAVKDASPFPPLPEELNTTEHEFTIPISFEGT